MKDHLLQKRIVPWVTTLLVILLQEILARTEVLPRVVPPFSSVVNELWTMLPTAEFLDGLINVLEQFFLSLLIGVVLGIAIGVINGLSPTLNRATHYILEALRFTPAVVFIPILLLLLGATPKTSILLGALGATWPVLYQTFYGVAGISYVLKDTGLAFGLTTTQRLKHITVPSVSPFLAVGIRLAASHALIVVVAVQIIAAIPGLGRDIKVYAENGVFTRMYALILVIGLMGVIINWIFENLERHMLHWHASHRKATA